MTNVVSMLRDGLMSLASRMGTDRDKAATTFYAHTVLTDEQLIAAYATSWLPRKIVDIPALDACRKWRDWQAKKPQIAAIEEEEQRLNVKGKILEAVKKGRLFGGAAVYIGTGEPEAEISRPLDIERIKKGGVRYLNVMTRRQLSAGEIDRNPESDWYGKPRDYTLSGATGQQITIHPSRLVLFNGAMPADDEMTAYQGWGDSVLQSTLHAIKNADSTAGNIASLIFEAKIDIIKVPNFSASIGNPAYEDAVLRRYTLANTIKGINGTLILDAEEEYESKSAQLGGLTDILMAFMQIVSGAADIPVTRLLGQSPAGMNSTGSSDMKNYHDRIQSMQELEMQPAMRRLDEALERSADVRDTTVYYRWSPLEQMSEKERAEIFKANADAARTIVGSGTGQEIIAREAMSDALVNRLVEDGVLPGLDAAVAKHGTVAEQEPTEEELAAAAAAQQPNANNVVRMQQAANDAAPRTLYVRRDVINRADIVKWAEGQGFTDIVPDLHVTIAYSKTPVDWFEMGESWSPRLEIGPGGPRQVEAFGDDGKYKVLLITASELVWRHRAMVEAGATWDWPDYQPHISIQVGGEVDLSKVEPYQGKIVLGPEIFEELRED